ncbi:MAG: phosphatase PAP2 family protein [Christensenellales bacterium]
MEIGILEWINANLHGSNFVNYLFKFITYLGEDGIAWALVGAILLCFKRTRKAGLIMLAGFATVVVVNHLILKNIFDRPRPFSESNALAEFITGIGMKLPTSSSFPSGHTTISITCAVILTMCFGKKGAWAFIPATLISLSRIFLCVHYPSDVLGGVVEGIILGVVVTIVGRLILNKLEKWWLNKKNAKKLTNIQEGVVVQSKEDERELKESKPDLKETINIDNSQE